MQKKRNVNPDLSVNPSGVGVVVNPIDKLTPDVNPLDKSYEELTEKDIGFIKSQLDPYLVGQIEKTIEYFNGLNRGEDSKSRWQNAYRYHVWDSGKREKYDVIPHTREELDRASEIALENQREYKAQQFKPTRQQLKEQSYPDIVSKAVR